MLTSFCSVYENLNRDEAKIAQATSVGILTVNHCGSCRSPLVRTRISTGFAFGSYASVHYITVHQFLRHLSL